jgi:LCP family protein required for cell wall assembly
MDQNQAPKRKKINSRQLFILAVAVFVGIGIILSAVTFTTFFKWGEAGGIPFDLDEPELNAEGTPIAPGEDDGSLSSSNLPNVPEIDVLPWDGTKRVTMLVMGVDQRDWEAGSEYSRTDTMMLLTIDPVAKTAGALSIPRDLWAAIPGFNPAKINTAHYFGDLYKYPGGGPALAVKTVENIIGVPIDYYVRLDFNAFVEFIDFIDGVKVDVTEPIELEIIGQAYDVKLEPGVVTLDGKLALAYARNRYNEGGDFDRARRQQQIILAIRNRLTNPAILAKLVTNAPELYNRFSQKVSTNMPLEDMLRLTVLALQVKQDDIDMAVIGLQESNFGRSPDDLSILIPYPDQIRVLRDRIFGTGGAFSPAAKGDEIVQMSNEKAKILILDGATDGGVTAQRTADHLISLGVENVSVQPAGQTYARTTLVIKDGVPYTLSYLANLMSVNTPNILHRLDINGQIDLEIWLGTDWQNNNTLP